MIPKRLRFVHEKKSLVFQVRTVCTQGGFLYVHDCEFWIHAYFTT